MDACDSLYYLMFLCICSTNSFRAVRNVREMFNESYQVKTTAEATVTCYYVTDLFTGGNCHGRPLHMAKHYGVSPVSP